MSRGTVVLGVGIHGERDGGNLEERGLHRGRHRPRVYDVFAEIVAAVDPAHDEIDFALEDFQHSEAGAIGRAAV